MPELPELKIIYPVGHHAAGKTELCDYLTTKYGFTVIETGVMMRQLYAEREDKYQALNINDYVKCKLSDDENYFDQHLDDLIKQAEADNDLVAVNGMRSNDNIQRIKASRPDASHATIWIDAPSSLLYKRYLRREKVQISFEEFCNLLQVDLTLGLGEVEELADYQISNQHSIEELWAGFDRVMKIIASKAILHSG